MRGSPARVLLLGLVVLTSACSTPGPVTEPRDGAPANPPRDLARQPDPVPTEEPKSKYGNPESYEVFGKTYRTMSSHHGYAETGVASWYGSKFHGRRTSSGERYDMYKLTAAHRSLPIPTYVRVTNLDNQKSTVVRVNDRGPFHSDRIIDLSYAAAVKLGFQNRGTARVRIEALTGTPESQARVAEASPATGAGAAVSAPVLATGVPMMPPGRGAGVSVAGGTPIYLQAGAFRHRAGAERLRDSLLQLVGGDVHILQGGSDGLYRVRVGPIADMGEAQRLQAMIADANQGRPVIVRE